MATSTTEYLIVGAGPTGLGAALRLVELGKTDWIICERENEAGGLAGSVVDDNGFTWDMGGHIQFSHYQAFDRYMDVALGDDGWLHHERESWVWIANRFVPYPFQNNLHRLPANLRWKCVAGLLEAAKRIADNTTNGSPSNFREWLLSTFGAGLTDLFLFPYNWKVWAYPLESLGFRWVGERVAIPPLDRVIRNICLEEDDVSWGPNNTFRFPVAGGTGAVWRALAARLPMANMKMGRRMSSVDTRRRTAILDNGERIKYRHLISTIPVDRIVELARLSDLSCVTAKLWYSSTHVVGIGMDGAPAPALEKKCWMYFPESTCPFYRVTVFSNYSPRNVPEPSRQWSLMAEISESRHKPVNSELVVSDVVAGLRSCNLISPSDKIVSTWHRRLGHGYPTPVLDRDATLAVVLPALERVGIYSRGRFGAWKYEVSNQDHSFAQGREVVDRLADIVCEESGAEPTLNRPGWVNSRMNR